SGLRGIAPMLILVTHAVRNFTVRPNRKDDLVGQDPDFLAWADELWAANRTGPWSRGLWHSAAWLGLPVGAPKTYESLAAMVGAQNAADYLPAGTDPTVVAGYQARLRALAEAMRSNNTVWYMHNFSGDNPVDYFVLEHPLSVGTIGVNVSSPESE